MAFTALLLVGCGEARSATAEEVDTYLAACDNHGYMTDAIDLADLRLRSRPPTSEQLADEDGLSELVRVTRAGWTEMRDCLATTDPPASLVDAHLAILAAVEDSLEELRASEGPGGLTVSADELSNIGRRAQRRFVDATRIVESSAEDRG